MAVISVTEVEEETNQLISNAFLPVRWKIRRTGGAARSRPRLQQQHLTCGGAYLTIGWLVDNTLSGLFVLPSSYECTNNHVSQVNKEADVSALKTNVSTTRTTNLN